MKKLHFTIIASFLFGSFLIGQNNLCSRTTTFGDQEICMPKIEGYQECYEHDDVKLLADATEVEMNEVLGYYLNDKAYAQVDNLFEIEFDDYFKIYATTAIKDEKADKVLLKQMQELLSENFIVKNWDELKLEVDNIGIDAEIGVPTVIKSYNLNEDSFSFIMLITYEFEGIDPYTMVVAVNGMLINERLVWMAYYFNFDGEESVDTAQENSNRILEIFIKANQ